jgi:hypothetical protein
LLKITTWPSSVWADSRNRGIRARAVLRLLPGAPAGDRTTVRLGVLSQAAQTLIRAGDRTPEETTDDAALSAASWTKWESL